ncbi:MAG TPA: DUF6069 family protein [Aquihabitans sp.]|jgi:hypothetical protein|nr:DUF6069 family protein [Aquihabitans sp.]
MTQTFVPTTTTDAPVAPVAETVTDRPLLWRAGLASGVVAGAATTALAAVASAAGTSLDIAGEAIPVIGFAQLTIVCAAIGVVIARVLARRARHPRSTFTRTTVGLTLLSLVPDVTAQAATSTKLLLIATHLVAAAIVIPVLAGRLADR